MVETLREYASKKIDLLKLEATEKSVLSAGTITYIVAAFLAFLFFILMFNIGIGLLIGHYFGNYAYGILVVAGFYLLVLILVLASRKTIKNFVANKILKSIND